jgi:ABC-type multidrug transport system fused ATPase/permease subunit
MLWKVWQLLKIKEKAWASLVLLCILFQGVVETLSLGAVVPLLAILAKPEEALQNELIALAYSSVGSPAMPHFIAITCCIVFVIFVIKNLYILGSDVMQARFCLALQRRLATELLAGYLNRDYDFYFRNNTTILLRIVTGEVTAIAQGVLLYGLIFLSEIVTVSGILLLMFFANAKLSMALGLAAGIIIGAIYVFIRRPSRRIGEICRNTTNQLFKQASEALQGVKDVKVLGRADFFVSRYDAVAAKNSDALARARVMSGMPRLILESAVIGGITGIVLISQMSNIALNQIIPLLALYAVSAYRLMPSAGRILSSLAQFRLCSPSVEVVYSALMDSRAKPKSASALKRLSIENSLEFQGVRFSFDGATEALKGISFKLERGKSVGLVGSSGAGKSTLADLVLGLLYPSEGKILIDGRELTSDQLEAWQKNLGYVPQQIFLADDSLRRNIAFGVADHQIDEASVNRAISLARLEDLVCSIPDGLDARVGEKGIQLSGGQRQRVGIARALYHDPEVLILDEATSALDTVTEAQFSEAVKALSGQKTLLIIAHRLSTVRDCDSILMLDHGELKAQGTYQDLLGSSPEFRALANHQTAGAR